jgi:hypothetical protein
MLVIPVKIMRAKPRKLSRPAMQMQIMKRTLHSEKSLGIPNVHKSYYITDKVDLGSFRPRFL